MRRLLIVTVSLLAAGGSLAACQKKTEAAKTGEAPQASAKAPAPLSGPPARKPGLWTQTVSTGGMTQTSKMCLDAATDKEISAWGQQGASDICSKNSVTPTPGGWKFESVCDMGGGAGQIATTGQATGDFNSKYTVKATSVTSGAAAAQMNGTHEMTVEAAWEGPCPAGMKAGDVSLPGGMTINLSEMRAKK